METPDRDINDQDQKQETLSDTRVHPDHVFDAVATKEEFIRPGEWIYSFEETLYEDVLTAAWLEGYFVRQIEHQENGEIQVKIQEEEPVNAQKQSDEDDSE